MSGTITQVSPQDYASLLTIDKPVFQAWVYALTAPYAAITNFCNNLQEAFDLDIAVGAQLDIIGLWVGITRQVVVAITGVFFTWDIAGVGWDQGVWLGPYEPTTGVTFLADNDYRFLLRGKIAANHWNGTAGNAAEAYQLAFTDTNVQPMITDNQNMTMTVTFENSQNLSALQVSLILDGYINIRPMGVSVNYVFAIMSESSLVGTATTLSGFQGLVE
jgi:hypothetical protein